MKNESIWWKDIKPSKECKLNKNIKVDVLVIGGGITGISCCYQLKDSHLKVALVEANKIGSGITSKTTGKLTFLQDGIYSKIKKYSGYNNAYLYYKAQKDAIMIVKDIIKSNRIRCNFKSSNSYLFTEDKSNISKIKEEKDLLVSFREKIKDVSSLPNGCKCYGIEAEGCYYFHPLKYLEALKKILVRSGVDIYEDTRVYSIDLEGDDYLVSAGDNFIQAKKIVLAMHYTYFVTPFFMPFKVHLEKSYVGAISTEDKYSFNAISLDKPVKSIRFFKEKNMTYQIFLYGSRNIAMDVCDEKYFEKLGEVSKNFCYMWSNIDIITGDGLPYVGEIKNNLFIATGYNTWGMTNSAIASKVIKDLILGNKNKYKDLFDPKRGVKISSLPLVFLSSAKSFIESKVDTFKSWYKNVRIENIDGKKVGIYTDLAGVEHKVFIKCPHLGCNLFFNEKELTWDCPCHGSRFSVDGKVIEGPANFDISYKEE